MKKIWAIIAILSFIILSFLIKNFYFTENQTNSSWVLENISTWEIEEVQIDRKVVDSKIETLKKKMKLSWLITKANMYYDDNEYMNALMEYLEVLKEVPNDEETNLRVWEIYYKINNFKKANEYFTKIKNSSKLDNDKAIFSLINEKWVTKENLESLQEEINSFKISDEKKFYYTNSIVCITDYSLCRDHFQKYFDVNKNLETEEMKKIKTALENFKNFKSTDLYYKAAFITWAFYENWFHYVALKTAENILEQKYDYKPIMELAAKSAYTIGNYEVAKKFLTDIKEQDLNNPDISYFLARVYEKTWNRVPALVNYQKALADGYKDEIDVKRRIIFIYFEGKEYKKMLKAFNDLLNTKSEELNATDYSLAIYYNIINDELSNAKIYTEIAMEKFKENAIFSWYLAWILLQKEELTEEETEIVKKNLEIINKSPSNSLSLMVNWIYEFRTKNYNKAIILFKNAYSKDKSSEYREIINAWLQKTNEEKNSNN